MIIGVALYLAYFGWAMFYITIVLMVMGGFVFVVSSWDTGDNAGTLVGIVILLVGVLGICWTAANQNQIATAREKRDRIREEKSWDFYQKEQQFRSLKDHKANFDACEKAYEIDLKAYLKVNESKPQTPENQAEWRTARQEELANCLLYA